ncbi:hypothetical protein [Amycolatopsis thermalba]|uniref:hypothetical protein n=1 Tax=Amycolatopsis thermalba TaxID=944492 RepID=UPI001ABF4324|nr:hypothetical protein [Amycolatopsis thermalba]
MRLLGTAEAPELVPRLYAEMGLPRAGMIERPGVWWSSARHRLIGEHQVAVHSGPRGDDGFVLFRTEDVRQRLRAGAQVRGRGGGPGPAGGDAVAARISSATR